MISPQQLSSILSQLPAQIQLHAPVQSPISNTTQPFSHLSLNNDKTNFTSSPIPAPPPPAYASGPQVLSLASALYAYSPTDAGDLALEPNDRVQVTEHMNNDCKFVQLRKVDHKYPAARFVADNADMRYFQGGEVGTSELDSRVSSLGAMSTSSKRSDRMHLHQMSVITGTCH